MCERTFTSRSSLGLILAAALAACGGGETDSSTDPMGTGTPPAAGADGSGTPPPPATDNVDFDALEIAPTPMHSAFDGVNTFSLPAFVPGTTTDLEDWRAEPADAVALAPWESDDQAERGVLITLVRHVAEIDIMVVRGALGGRSTLKVTSFTPEQTAVGRDRYTMGESFDLDEFISMTGPSAGTDGASRMVPGNLRCDTCHTEGADNLEVMNTPLQTAVYSDEELRTIFTMGIKPVAVGFKVLPEPAQPFYPLFHTWEASDEQIGGLIAYLRSLEPKGQGEVIRPDTSDLPSLPPLCLPQDPAYNMAACDALIAMGPPPVCQMQDPAFDRMACEEFIANVGM